MKNARLLGRGAPLLLCTCVMLLNLITKESHAQAPVANFSANVVTGCSPLIVNFTDQSTGNPTSWLWDLGNASTSAIQNPTATYTTPGSYTIKLTVTNGFGSNSTTKTNYITVVVAPAAEFTASKTSGCTPLTVSFTDQSSSANGTITQWEWNFGDGGTSNQKNPTHTYTTSGTFNVFLKVTNSSGCTQTVFKQQYINAGSGATANFNANVPNSCQLPITVTFANTSQTNGASVTYLWEFGDGATSTAVNPSHTYTTAGSFTVKLNIQSPDGCNSTTQKNINLTSRNVTISGPASLCAGATGNFSMSSSQNPLSQNWNMGDGVTYATPSVTHTYGGAGSYTVTLTTEFPGGCIATTTHQLTVNGGPAIDFQADTTKACKPPFPVSFQTTGASATGFNWDFGDGTTSTQQNPSHTYQSAGSFTVKLSATDGLGCATTVTKSDFIQIQPPTVAITNLPINDGCTPYSFEPKADIKATEGVKTYLWDFGNGVTSTKPKAGYTYRTSGTYTISLKIETNGGCVETVTYNNAVTITGGDSINFTAIPPVQCVDRPVQFDMYSAGNPVSVMWYFGDGDSSAVPTHSYKESNKFDVTMQVKYATCTSRLTKEEYVDIRPPEAKFSAVRDCTSKRLIRFTNQTKGTGNMLWDFGDGATSTLENPSHPYAADGQYTVTLNVDNGTCSHTFTKTIDVSTADIDLTADKTVVCKNENFILKGVVPNTVDATQYQWTIVGYNTANTAVDTIDWTVAQAGVYDVSLTVTSSDGCTEAVTKSSYLTVYGPTAQFLSDKFGGCLNTTINFRDSSSSDGIHPITQWSWDFGDTTTGSGTNVSHTYPNFGKYPVTLAVTDSYGCVDKLTKNDFVNITNGKAMFTSEDSLSCRGRNVVFTDTSAGSISFWEWDFGDGNTLSGVQSPAHNYADSGIYTVKLKVIENSGCADSVTKVNYVRIADPRAKFSLSDTFSTCPPLSVNFYDQSYYASKWSWDFDDGGSSQIPNPVNLYNIPKNYRVKLTVTSPGGCTDSTFANIRILGPYGQFNYSPLSGCTPFPVTYSVQSTEAVKFMWDYSDGIVDSGTVANSSHIYTTGGKFVPKVILTDAAGCRVAVIGTDTIYLEKTELSFTADKLSFCDTGTVVFTNNSIVNAPAATYEWSFGDGSSATTQDATHQYTTPSWYNVTLKATTPMGCVDTLTKQGYVRINNSPVADIISPDSLCKPANFTFTPQLQPDTSGIKTWQWTFGNGQTSDVENPPAQLFSTEGSYTNTLYVEDNQGCSTTVSKVVVVHPLPVLQVSQESVICRGDSAQLSVSGASSYTWTPANNLSCTNCSDPVASPALDTWYKVEGQSDFGCSSFDSVQVRVFQPYKINVDLPKDSICLGRGMTVKAFGAPMYSWSPADGLSSTTSANPFVSPQATTTYKIVGYDNKGCFRDSTEITIKVNPVPSVDAGPDLVLSAGSTANIQANASPDATSFQWSPVVGLSSSTVLNPTVTGGNDMTYSIRVMNEFGCVAQDQLKVIVTCTEGNLFVPNTFTPNGDGMNDVFYVRGKGLYAVKSLRIYNRWGEMVFEKKDVTPNDPNSGWNGMYKGAFASTDTYVYQLEVLCNNSQVLKYNGTISLIR